MICIVFPLEDFSSMSRETLSGSYTLPVMPSICRSNSTIARAVGFSVRVATFLIRWLPIRGFAGERAPLSGLLGLDGFVVGVVVPDEVVETVVGFWVVIFCAVVLWVEVWVVLVCVVVLEVDRDDVPAAAEALVFVSVEFDDVEVSFAMSVVISLIELFGVVPFNLVDPFVPAAVDTFVELSEEDGSDVLCDVVLSSLDELVTWTVVDSPGSGFGVWPLQEQQTTSITTVRMLAKMRFIGPCHLFISI